MGKLLESKISLERELYESQIKDLKAQVEGLEAKLYNVEAASRLQAANFEKRLAELETQAVHSSGKVVNGVMEEMARKVVCVESGMLGCSKRVGELGGERSESGERSEPQEG